MKLRLIGTAVCMALPALAASEGTEPGQEVFRARCIACHAISCNRVGPKLGGLIGRKVGGVPDFEGYSAELKSAGFVRTEEELDKFLADPSR